MSYDNVICMNIYQLIRKMNKNRNLYTLSLLFAFLSIILISAQNLIKITNSLPVNALSSKAKIIEIVAKNVNSRQQDNGIQRQVTLQIIKYKMVR